MSLPPLREVIEQYGLKATKALGQNFLCDLNLTGRIARVAGDLSECLTYEVGPGPGGLTRALLMQGANLLVCERDDRCIPALKDISNHFEGKLTIVSGDALEFSPQEHANGRAIKIVANLPYNIATPLLIGWLKSGHFASMTLMFQREVADRIVAQENDEAYGRLSVLCNLLANTQKAFDIHPSNFVPPPKIWSSVVHFTPKLRPPEELITALEKVTHAAFGQRRKMLRQSLKTLNLDVKQLLERAEIREDLRAENLSLDEFVRLAKATLGVSF